MAVTLWFVSLASFIIIELPGKNAALYIAIQQARESSNPTTVQMAERLATFYGIDATPLERYFLWLRQFFTGDLGRAYSYQYSGQAVIDILKNVIPPTMLLAVVSTAILYAVAIPLGMYAATRQYKIADYLIAVVGFAGMATPNFLLALLIMVLAFRLFGITPGGLFSTDMAQEPWSLAKVWDLVTHLWIAVLVVVTAGTARMIWVVRAAMLDELSKGYVMTARAKGIPERKLLVKYPTRIALNPIISSAAFMLPEVFSASTITAIVLSLPMTGVVLLDALRRQDMHMAGAIIVIEAGVVLVGTLVSDILLMVADPRIRMEREIT